MADVIDNAMARLGITDPTQQSFIRGLVQVEAGGRTTAQDGGIIYGKPIVSGTHKGDRAMGPLQVMPKTFSGVVRESGLNLDPKNNQDLATAGVWLAMDNLRRAGGDYGKAAAAHLGGPAAMNKTINDATSGDNTAAYAKRVLAYMGNPTQPATQMAQRGGVSESQYQDMVASLMNSADASGQNPMAAILDAQQAGALPELGAVQQAQAQPTEPSWQQNLRGLLSPTPSTNWIPGVAQQAINELPKIDTQRLQEDVDQVQAQRLAQAFGEPVPTNFRLPAAVDRYMDNLLES